MPAGHALEHVGEPAAETEPLAHGAHTTPLEKRVVPDWYVPAAHGEHVPGALSKVPSQHAPAWQGHAAAEHALAPGAEHVLGAHEVQSLPEMEKKFAAHTKHDACAQ